MNVPQTPPLPVKRPGVHNEAEVPLQGTWLVMARITWVTVSVLAVSLFVASLPTYFVSLHVPAPFSYAAPQLTLGDISTLQHFGLSLDFYAWVNVSESIIILLVYVLVGVVLFWRKSDDRLALLASFSLVLFPVVFSAQVVETLPTSWDLAATLVGMLGNISLGLFLFVFPSGQFIPRWASVLMVVWIAYWVIADLFSQVPFAYSLPFFLLFPVTVLCMIAFQIYRYRRVSTSVQRQQTKWVIAGFTFAFGPLMISQILEYTLLVQLFPTSSLSISLLQMACDILVLLFPLFLSAAILRARLWDIDVLVNRALVYGTLTLLLGVIYASLVIGCQLLLRAFTQQTSDVVIVASTLAVAALFQPLRYRLQQIIDRRFYRRKYDAARTLAAFAATLRSEVEVEQVRIHLLTAIQETMQPAHVSLWLRGDERRGIDQAHEEPGGMILPGSCLRRYATPETTCSPDQDV